MRHKHFIALFAAAGILLPAQQAASFTSPVPEFRDSIHLAPKKNKKDKNKNQKKAKGKKGKTAEDEQAPSTFPTTIAGLTYSPTTRTHQSIGQSYGVSLNIANTIRFNYPETHPLHLHPHLSPHEVHMHAREHALYKHFHPTLRAWIERAYRENPDNVIYLGYIPDGTARVKEPQYVLYKSEPLQKNGTSGCSIMFGHHKFYCYLLHPGKAEEAWTLTKEPAVNPHTGRPWICLTPTEQKKVESLGSPLSDKDKRFLQDVQDILNENFHYFYGMAYVRPEEQGISNEQLFAKLIPDKNLYFGKSALELCGEHATPQQQRLYSALGHPVYSYKKFPFLMVNSTPHCASLLLTSFFSQQFRHIIGKRYYSYFQNPCFGQTMDFSISSTTLRKDNLFIENSNLSFQHGHYCASVFPIMLEGLRQLCSEQGGNTDTESANTTALSLSLYYLYKRTELYCNTIILHLYTHVVRGDATDGFGSGPFIPRHYKRMSDEIALPGVPGTGRQIRAKKHNDE